MLSFEVRSRPGRLASLVLAAGMAVAVAQPAAADWKEDLAAQLRWDHDCLVEFYSGVIERLIDGNLVVIAKAHCDDGRSFDAIQRDELQEFEVEECTTKEQVC